MQFCFLIIAELILTGRVFFSSGLALTCWLTCSGILLKNKNLNFNEIKHYIYITYESTIKDTKGEKRETVLRFPAICNRMKGFAKSMVTLVIYR